MAHERERAWEADGIWCGDGRTESRQPLDVLHQNGNRRHRGCGSFIAVSERRRLGAGHPSALSAAATAIDDSENATGRSGV